jgi:hypothetical protein
MKKRLYIGLFLLLIFPASFLSASDGAGFDPVPILLTAQGSGGVPVGGIIPWPVATNPPDPGAWLECNGQSTAGYPELAAVVGTTVPDYRGLFLRGYGAQRYSQENGSTIGVTQTIYQSGELRTIQGDAIRNITGTTNINSQAGGAFYRNPTMVFTGTPDVPNVIPPLTFDASLVVPVAVENRPVNTAVRYLIRARQ